MSGDSPRTRDRVLHTIPVLVVAVFFAHLGRAAESPPQQLPELDEQAALRRAETVGLAIYQHDRGAWVATDAIATIGGIQPEKGVRGWITEEKGDDIVVTFIGAEDHHLRQALYRVNVSKEGRVTGPPQELKVPEDLNESASGAAAARTFALKAPFPRCTDDYNTVVLPGDASATPNWVVYILPATKDPNHIPLGGAHRYELDTTGQHLISERGFTKSCLVLGDPKGDPKRRPAGLVATHLLDPVPTEIHVFWNLWAGIPLYIATPPNGTICNISKGAISLVQRGKAK
jgi:hypothetical protein